MYAYTTMVNIQLQENQRYIRILIVFGTKFKCSNIPMKLLIKAFVYTLLCACMLAHTLTDVYILQSVFWPYGKNNTYIYMYTRIIRNYKFIKRSRD